MKIIINLKDGETYEIPYQAIKSYLVESNAITISFILEEDIKFEKNMLHSVNVIKTSVLSYYKYKLPRLIFADSLITILNSILTPRE